MKLSSKQKAILYGSVLGDGYLQKTGKDNARLRIEHSYNQKDYVYWKYEQLRNLFSEKPKKIDRIHPKTHKHYQYLRLQSHSSPILGRLQKILYDDFGGRRVTQEIEKLLRSKLTLAVWYMDDGYYYRRDKSIHIYLPLLKAEEIETLVKIFLRSYMLLPKWYCRPDRRGCQLNFTGIERDKFIQRVRPYILPYFHYKLP